MAAGQRILVIDDDKDNADAFAVLFQSWGYTVSVARDGESALALATAELPDAVVTDLGLPTFDDGREVVARLRVLPGGDALLIVAVTGWGSDLDRRKAIGAGCDFFFVKPAELDQLQDALRTIAAHKQWVERGRSG